MAKKIKARKHALRKAVTAAVLAGTAFSAFGGVVNANEMSEKLVEIVAERKINTYNGRNGDEEILKKLKTLLKELSTQELQELLLGLDQGRLGYPYNDLNTFNQLVGSFRYEGSDWKQKVITFVSLLVQEVQSRVANEAKLKGDMLKTTAELEQMKGLAQEAKAAHKKVEEQLKEASYKAESKTKELEEASQKLTDVMSRLQMTEHMVKEVHDEAEAANETIKEKDQEINGLKKDLKEANVELAGFEAQVKELKDQVATLTEEKATLDAEVADLEAQNADLEGKLAVANKEIEELKTTIAKMEEEHAKAKAELEALIKAKDEMIAKLEKDLANQKNFLIRTKLNFKKKSAV
ncbi:hypothetical protein N1495_08965 [Streptococcus didelphis]|uniref:hypothetical protein n=1 Tax=Streptococcus didelphis TaxID=102886 RepID=UPI0027D3496F|nr:hypothetical protein [Streptococcus didelphis]WMB29418.1 hypothetical protein N1495_08965 [Streptococcus didelphis]